MLNDIQHEKFGFNDRMTSIYTFYSNIKGFSPMKTKLVLASLLIAVLGLSACTNTFHGAGKDMEDAGEWVQDTF